MSIVPNAPYNLANLFISIARENRERVAIMTPDDSVQYGQLQDLVLSFGAHLQHNGVGQGDCVALNVGHHVIGVALTIACALVGCAWVNIDGDPAQFLGFPETRPLQGRIKKVLYDGETPLLERSRLLFVDPRWSRPPGGQGLPEFPGYRTPEDDWMIAKSSGTTGTVKFMGMSEIGMWKRTIETGAYRYEAIGPRLAEHPVLASLFPPFSYVGISDAFRAIALGGTIVFPRGTEFIGRFPVDIVVGSPAQFRALLEAPAPAGGRIPLAAIGGAPPSPRFLAGMLRYFVAVNDVYGSSEGGLITTNLVTNATDLSAPIHGGTIAPGVTVEILAEDGTVLPAGQEGIVSLRTPWQVDGYIGNPELTAEAFGGGGAFRPGDLGFISASGKLHITGRVNEQLNIGGVKVNPDMVDGVMLATPGISDAACFAAPMPDGLARMRAVVVIGKQMRQETVLRSLGENLRTQLSAGRRPGQLYVLPALPRNANGKVARHQLPDVVAGMQAIDLPEAG